MTAQPAPVHRNGNGNGHARNLDVEAIDLARRLRARRLEAGLTRQELAERATMTERSVRDIENGRRPRIQEKTLMLLAEALGCEPAELAVLPPVPPGATAPQPAPPVRPFRWPLLLATVLLTVALAVLATVWFAIDRAQWEIVEGDLIMRDAVLGQVMWTLDEHPVIRQVVEPVWGRGLLLVAFNGNTAGGHQAVLLNRRTGEFKAGYAMDVDLARRAFGDEILAEGQDFSCGSMHFIQLDGTGPVELFCRFTHGKYYPSGLGVFDADGTVRGMYAHRGHVGRFIIEDLDDDGADELLALGTNNDLAYQGATVVYLEEGAWSGASVDPPGAAGKPAADGRLTDGSRYRVIFPAFDAGVMEQMKRLRLDAFSPRTHRMDDGTVRITCSVGCAGKTGVAVVCDDRLRPLSVGMNDSFRGEVSTWPAPYGEPGHFPDQALLDAWLAQARWSAGNGPVVRGVVSP